ncbi:MAG: histidinol-phosphatase HisJ family protein [Clostridia bacterium]|nr:histidinol-phosphatase HisJ family protein [Clostridia bacterium]
MKNKQNLHIHTTYADGKDSPEKIVLAAIAKGFDSIGFSEHTYMEFSDFPYQMTIEDMVKYKAEIYTLKEKYKNQINIFCGLEYELFSEVPVEGFDYLIGSVHYLDFEGKKISFDKGVDEVKDFINKNFGADGLRFAKKYFETLLLLPQKHTFDILGHFDILTKTNELRNFIDTTSKEYLNYGYEAINNLKGKIPLFEVNTGAIARGYRTTPYPQTEFLREFKNCGFGVVITSDCHNKDFIDCYYSEARELLLEAGFNTKWILTANGFKEVEL